MAGATLALLAALVDKSLLQAEGKRFESHPLLRQYAAEKLAERPEAKSEVEARHGAYFLGYAQAAGGQADELARLDLEIAEILLATQRADARGDGATLVALMRRLAVDGPYYSARGHTARSLDLMRSAVTAAKAQGDMMTAHLLLSRLGNTYKLHQGDRDSALAAYREALELAEQLGDHHRRAILLSAIGQTRFEQGDHDDAAAYLDRAYELAREQDDAVALNHVLQHQGQHAGARSDWEGARRLCAEALEVLERSSAAVAGPSATHDYQLFMALLNLGEPERMLGNFARALELRERALGMAEARDNRLWRAYAVHELGEVYHSMNDRAMAQRQFDEALALWEQNHVQVKADDLRKFLAGAGYRVGGGRPEASSAT